ncbi:glycosyltransferase family 2 protein [Haloarcula sp. S1AR25-5A]|uniref:Glycosyltransferase family 2 protein n=1 Tax=Haloarcula terrestris TaxID=2950533 RepID=A0AAE4JHS2_9EURY|nr:glycosyltransferase family A protein [Haloarcula terrestris]MDS0222832.1 glycosyltransferase family 2 protein [Haloarcula terrestris]
MSQPLVSVVIPTYKRPDKLRRATRSVAEQTYPNIELIVVDDHSPQPASDTLSGDSFDGLNLVCIRHEENRGANEARNTGISEADGEYIALLDDDDDWQPKKISKQVDVFQRSDDSVGVVYTGCEYDYGSYTREVIFTCEGTVAEDLFVGKSFGEFSTLMVRRDVIEAAGLPDERFPSWQDREWLIRLSQHTEFRVIQELLTRRHCPEDEERISNNYTEKRDVSFPLLVEKHRDLARSYGRKYERLFLASLLFILGQDALRNRFYSDARKQLLKSVYYYPFDADRVIYALVAFGGRLSYEPARYLARTMHGRSDGTITE